MFVVEVGTVDIVPTGKELAVATIGSGQTFGEMAFFNRGNRPASARAREMSDILRIPFDRLERLLGERPDLAVTFYRNACGFLAKHVRTLLSDLTAATSSRGGEFGEAREKLEILANDTEGLEHWGDSIDAYENMILSTTTRTPSVRSSLPTTSVSASLSPQPPSLRGLTRRQLFNFAVGHFRISDQAKARRRPVFGGVRTFFSPDLGESHVEHRGSH